MNGQSVFALDSEKSADYADLYCSVLSSVYVLNVLRISDDVVFYPVFKLYRIRVFVFSQVSF